MVLIRADQSMPRYASPNILLTYSCPVVNICYEAALESITKTASRKLVVISLPRYCSRSYRLRVGPKRNIKCEVGTHWRMVFTKGPRSYRT